jgi:hypothetical protein
VWLEKNKVERSEKKLVIEKEALQWNRAIYSRRRTLFLQRREEAKCDRVRNV